MVVFDAETALHFLQGVHGAGGVVVARRDLAARRNFRLWLVILGPRR